MPYGFYDDHTTKRLVIAAMEAGLPWDVARQRANAPVSGPPSFAGMPALAPTRRPSSRNSAWPRLAGDPARPGLNRHLLLGPSPYPITRPHTPSSLSERTKTCDFLPTLGPT